MVSEFTPLFSDWLAAEKAAWAAEKLVYATKVAFARGCGERPEPEDADRANQLREEAGRLYPLAMAEMAGASGSLVWKTPRWGKLTWKTR